MEQPLHVLLVDDDADDREIFAWAIKCVHPSVAVDTAIDGLDALEKLETWGYRPDIIFLDLNMPSMNGFDFLARVRQMDTWSSLPIIVYSTSSNPQDMARSRVLGATDYIVKGNEVSIIKQDLLQAITKYHRSDPEHEYRK